MVCMVCMLLKERNETVTNCNALKLQAADGKMRLNAFQRVGTNCHPPFRSAPWWTAKNKSGREFFCENFKIILQG